MDSLIKRWTGNRKIGVVYNLSREGREGIWRWKVSVYWTCLGSLKVAQRRVS